MKWLVKPVVVILSLMPLIILATDAYQGNLSANPIDDITDTTGSWTLRFLMITLSVTPLRKLTGWNTLAQLRRMLGLFAFLYVSLHFTTYIWLDKFFEWSEVVEDVAKRPFITIGFASFVALIPLAATSFDRIMKWMGGKRWKLLHRLVYAAALGGVIHYLWLVKADRLRPLIYGGILAVLLGFRIWDYFKNLSQRRIPTRDEKG